MKSIFWFSLCFILYTYLGYPGLLFVWSRLFPKRVNKNYLAPEPMVSLVIAVRNEEKHIRTRIENLFYQDYAANKMEVIIVSDGSTDGTNEIISNLEDGIRGSQYILKFIKLDERRGKSHALNLAIREAKGEFIVFTDARQRFEQSTIRELVANFSDPKVGCVSGELIFYEESDTSIKEEMDFYWNLEKWVRKMESTVHSVAGATGAIYAIRKSLFQMIPDEVLLDDVLIPMNVVFQGFRTVFDGKAVAYDIVSKDMVQEKQRKIRTLAGNWQLISIKPSLLSPLRNPIFFQYLSHKVFRLFVPFFFITLLFSSLGSVGMLYQVSFWGMISFLILPFLEKTLNFFPPLIKISKMARLFISLNYAAALSFFYFFWPWKKNLW